MKTKLAISFLLVFLFAQLASAQTSTITYQGKLSYGGSPANGTYDFEFRLFDFTIQVAGPVAVNDLVVTNGVFKVQLDFGAAAFPGADRFLEIRVRPGTSTDPDAYTTLSPRQPLTSSPYSIKSSVAAAAESLSTACDLCVTDGQIQSLDGAKVIGTVANATTANNVSGVVAVANGGTGSSEQNFVDLSTNQTIGGNKTFTGSISGNGSGLTNINGANIANQSVTSAQIAPESLPGSTAYKLLGSLRWDLLKPQENFAVGTTPVAVAFDGMNIWVTNANSLNVTKLRASDGANLGGFAAGSNSRGVAFDGANIWVTNANNNNVTKLRASDGANLGNFAAGGFPLGVAFDGANIWTANASSESVTKLRASDGANLGSFAVGIGPRAVAFDGANIWVANFGSNNVTKLRASDGANLGNFAVGTGPFGVAFDGGNIWVPNLNSGNVTKLRASDGANLGNFAVGGFPIGVAFDGANIWVTSNGSNNVTKLRASDGTNLGSFAVGTGPVGVAFDGANIWVANADSNNVTRLFPAFPQP